jgi:translocation and assembly module TamB
LPLTWLDLAGQAQLAQLGLRGDVMLGGQWDATGGDALNLRAELARTSGDLMLLTEGMSTDSIQAGVRQASLSINVTGDQLAAALRWDSERAGTAQVDVKSKLQRQGNSWVWPEAAPLMGTLAVQLPPVGAWSVLAPPGWRLRGTLDSRAVLSGTRGAPQWRGSVQANDLAVRSVANGIDFSQGQLRASLDGQRLVIDEFSLRGAGGKDGGQLLVTGSVQWLASRLHIDLSAQARALRLTTRADQRLVVSGQLTAKLLEAHLSIQGTLKADSALFLLPDDTAPELGSDVVVRQAGKLNVTAVSPPKRITTEVELTLEPGPDFQVLGRGISTRLQGKLTLSTSARDTTPSLSGTLRTVRGSYQAYGQQLDIEQGVLRFSGAYNNPALDILAIRPNLTQRVGVQINGSALSPLVRLYAEPDLPDAEKLAWLVLGRSAANGGAETAVLQQAALALLGGKGKGLSASLAQAVGLDELSLRGAASTDTATLTLGKRLSRDFYVAYEHSLAGTLGTFSIFYDLSRRLTLRAQAGEQSAIDLIFTLRYD